MHLKSTVALAVCAVAVGIAVPAQASAATGRANPLPCTFGGYATPGNGAMYTATCTAPASQQWQEMVQCRHDSPREPALYYAWGNIVTGNGTSKATCGTEAGAYSNPYVVLV
ncbi:hypothetical protein KGQ20_13050 [Catenulispora sp. NF23]|uniref:Secreted protein n=1 Tax=Catenulispora pinistramenti TaxID=2705254 RepID=A0ABS5KTV8_9ACTN|nr:hypothetical protein [Catenulispora pinistramenti]MBS2533699.1 hypothetical protein [Catenulispora pinistramenti]MBS2549439.1 hypothetical protein [Catenulispora pinistramenti]